MKKIILVLISVFIYSFGTVNAQENLIRSEEPYPTSGVLEQYTNLLIGYTNLHFGGISSNGINLGGTMTNRWVDTGTYYGMDWSVSFVAQSWKKHLSMIFYFAPTTGYIYKFRSKFALEWGLSSGLTNAQLRDKLDQNINKWCFGSKAKVGVGYKHYNLIFEGGYYTCPIYDFYTFSVNYKYTF